MKKISGRICTNDDKKNVYSYTNSAEEYLIIILCMDTNTAHYIKKTVYVILYKLYTFRWLENFRVLSAPSNRKDKLQSR